MADIQHVIARAQGATTATDYQVTIRAGRHDFSADEPQVRGGTDSGPAPYELVLSGLAACTAITLRMYAKHKGWSLASVQVEVALVKQGDELHIERRLRFEDNLAPEQITGLLAIAERTPVTLTLKNGLKIHTELRPGQDSESP